MNTSFSVSSFLKRAIWCVATGVLTFAPHQVLAQRLSEQGFPPTPTHTATPTRTPMPIRTPTPTRTPTNTPTHTPISSGICDYDYETYQATAKFVEPNYAELYKNIFSNAKLKGFVHNGVCYYSTVSVVSCRDRCAAHGGFHQVEANRVSDPLRIHRCRALYDDYQQSIQHLLRDNERYYLTQIGTTYAKPGQGCHDRSHVPLASNYRDGLPNNPTWGFKVYVDGTGTEVDQDILGETRLCACNAPPLAQ